MYFIELNIISPHFAASYHSLPCGASRVVNPMFEGNRQQDAHELLHCLLDQLCHLPQDLRQGKPNGVLGPEASKMEQEEEPGFPEPKRLRRRSERIQAIEEDSSKVSEGRGR